MRMTERNGLQVVWEIMMAGKNQGFSKMMTILSLEGTKKNVNGS